MNKKIYETPFQLLPNKLEWSEYTSPQVEQNPSRWKTGQGWKKPTRLHNKMDAREGNLQYRYGKRSNMTS